MISNICICGAGTMGSGIAQLAASSALPAILYELDSGVLEKAKKTIDNNLQLLVEKGKINPGQKEKIFQSVHFTNDLNECVADVIIEAIIENIDAKIHLFKPIGKQSMTIKLYSLPIPLLFLLPV
jgi:3-hydroxybutyryl-CoA dehydrogenase